MPDDPDPDPDGDPPEGEPDTDDEPDPAGEGDWLADAVGELVLTGAALWLAGGVEEGGLLLGGAVEELLLGEGDGDVDVDADGEGDGEAEAEAGRAWHTVSVSDAAATTGLADAACAVASTLKVRKLPLSTVTAATRTCAKRISGLSPVLVRVTVCSSKVRRCLTGGWVPHVLSR